jgi:DNA-directed RNA polymerase subunit RPC12/RpoP
MDIQIAFRTPSNADLRRPKCPGCGSTLLIAEQSVFNPDGRIRHTWSCDDCGKEFVTSISIAPPQA